MKLKLNEKLKEKVKLHKLSLKEPEHFQRLRNICIIGSLIISTLVMPICLLYVFELEPRLTFFVSSFTLFSLYLMVFKIRQGNGTFWKVFTAILIILPLMTMEFPLYLLDQQSFLSTDNSEMIKSLICLWHIWLPAFYMIYTLYKNWKVNNKIKEENLKKVKDMKKLRLKLN